jgi:hypothetical protein
MMTHLLSLAGLLPVRVSCGLVLWQYWRVTTLRSARDAMRLGKRVG